jgi:cation transport ATPase
MDQESNAEWQRMARRFWTSLGLGLPVIALAMGDTMSGVGLPAWPPPSMSKWIQFALATPVVLWAGGPLLAEAWRSLSARKPNRFTLIGLGMLAAYLYSAAATLFPDFFPGEFRRGSDVALYFETAAAVTVLALMGQVLEHVFDSVETAPHRRLPIPGAADRAASHFASLVAGAAVLTFAAWSLYGPRPRLTYALLNAAAVLIVACPCALMLASPMSIMVGISRGTRNGARLGPAESTRLVHAIGRNIRQNLFLARVFPAIGVPLAAGVLYPFNGALPSPLLAVAVISFSSLSVAANAWRLKRARLDAFAPLYGGEDPGVTSLLRTP